MEKALSDSVRNIRKSLHDLAQPLSAVTGLVDLLLIEMAADDPRASEVQLLNEQLEKVLYIVGEIRRMAREASDGEPVRLEPSTQPQQWEGT